MPKSKNFFESSFPYLPEYGWHGITLSMQKFHIYLFHINLNCVFELITVFLGSRLIVLHHFIISYSLYARCFVELKSMKVMTVSHGYGQKFRNILLLVPIESFDDTECSTAFPEHCFEIFCNGIRSFIGSKMPKWSEFFMDCDLKTYPPLS
jgi:hypothetical protein